MIDNQELRIGNYLLMNRRMVQVGGIPNTIKLLIPGEQYAVEVEEFEPIPITEALLLKLGFENVGFYDNVYSKDNIRVHIDKNKEIDTVLFIMYNDGGSIFEKEVSSLHQLQNLYFALTGKEL